MTTPAPTLPPSLPALELTPDSDHGMWGRIGPFTWDLWEGERKLTFGVWHDSLPSSVLCFWWTSEECKAYIRSGEAATDYEQKCTEGRTA